MALNFKIPNVIKYIREGLNSGLMYVQWSSNTNYGKNAQKLKTVLENPAALFIFLLLTDLYSMGEYKMYKKGDESKEPVDHPVLELLRRPNPMQTEEQFKWDYMFWRMLGCANMLSDSKVFKGAGANRLYWLSPDRIVWPTWFTKNNHTVFLSDASVRELEKKVLKYRQQETDLPFTYKQLKQFFDISNGINGWFDVPSRVDALLKIVKNSDNILDSKNINSHLSRKFLVSGRGDPENTSQLPMDGKERESIENKTMSRKNITGVKSMVDIKRFLEDLGSLEKLDKAFMNDAFFIGKMYNIPKDVIESFEQGSTYENQEKARASIISYCVMPAANDFCRGLLDYFGITDHEMELDYSHLPFVQTFERDRAETMEKKANAFHKLRSAGADPQEAADALGLDLSLFSDPVNIGGGTQADDKKLKAV